MPHSAIGPIAIHLPERVEDIDQLAAEYDWTLAWLADKVTGKPELARVIPENDQP